MAMKKTLTFRISRIFGKPICQILFPLKVQNLQNLPKEGKAIVCCNHISMKDPIYLSMHSSRMMRYMAKKELFENKFASMIIRGMGAFPVDRGSAKDSGSIDYANEILRQGELLAIFIEGTRSKDGKLGRPKSGAAMLAYNNQAPVVPVCITTKFGQQPKMFHKAVINYGNLIPFEDLGIREGTGAEFRDASRLIMSRIADLRRHDQPIADALR